MSYVLCELIVKEKFKKERKNIDSAEIKKRIRCQKKKSQNETVSNQKRDQIKRENFSLN